MKINNITRQKSSKTIIINIEGGAIYINQVGFRPNESELEPIVKYIQANLMKPVYIEILMRSCDISEDGLNWAHENKVLVDMVLTCTDEAYYIHEYEFSQKEYNEILLDESKD